MADRAAAYDSRHIVENYLRHKLLKKGVAWPLHLPPRSPPAASSSSSSSSSSSPLSGEGVRTSRRGATPSPEGEEEEAPPAPPPSPCQPPRAAPHVARLQDVLQQAGDELEQRYHGDFNAQMCALLLWRPGALRPSLDAVRDELLGDGVNWGRVVVLLELGGALCVEAARRRWAGHVDDIASWMVESLEAPPLRGWIENNGGWDAFVDLYGQAGPAGRSWSLRTLVGLAALGAAGITLGALFTQK
ncbi:apoptosis regulator Bcl-2-like [Myripristis murdjan]|uniref:apoptosis regulator Bcl-2-like n=1 Tax=Myripristis murdjan TaxID=586833 RepID=UPI001175E849|nr:apoptosis regulator Bcl-2-like [Myripristis murdjan]